MSAEALQRVVVRMLYDPDLVARVYDDPDVATAEVALTDIERRWLVAPDRRAWGIDGMRPSRTLTAILDEYPISAALWLPADRSRRSRPGPGPGHGLGEPSGIARLLGFFGSPQFHETVQARGVLAISFGDYLVGLARGRRGPYAIATLEGAIARSRRSGPKAPRGRGDAAYGLGAGVVPVCIAEGALQAWSEARRQLGPAPLDAVVALKEPLVLGVMSPRADEHWLVAPGQDGEPGIGGSSAPLHRLLLAVDGGATEARLQALLAEEGLDPGEAAELLGELVADQTLRAL